MKRIVAAILVAGVLVLAGCAPATTRGTGGGDGGAVRQNSGNSGFSENTITLNDGRTITCITWSTWDYLHEAMSSGVDCDWERPASE